jgi:hypothetical protein
MNGLVEYVFRHLKTEFKRGQKEKWGECIIRHYYKEEAQKSTLLTARVCPLVLSLNVG